MGGWHGEPGLGDLADHLGTGGGEAQHRHRGGRARPWRADTGVRVRRPGAGAVSPRCRQCFRDRLDHQCVHGHTVGRHGAAGRGQTAGSGCAFPAPAVRVPAWGERQIELVDLATHTSGLPRLPANWRPTGPANPLAGYTAGQPYDFLSDWVLTREPGSQYEYSNAGVRLAWLCPGAAGRDELRGAPARADLGAVC